MKKLSFAVILILLIGNLFAGGIVTNTNQSAIYTRMQVRDATLGIDAVYFNPAGLSLLPNNGLFFSLNNQTLGQTRTITSNYTYLNESEYLGSVSAPVFPGIYAAYKMEKLTLSAGFNPIGGGGGGIYKSGLPSFEYAISELVPSLASQGATAYRMDVNFEGSSIFFGYQANVSYKINDMISVAIGGRYVTAKEAYNGYLRDIEVNMGGNWMRADAILSGIAAQADDGGDGLQPIIEGGGGTLTLAQAEGAGIISAVQRATIEGSLQAFGVPEENIAAMNIQQAQGAFYLAGDTYNAKASLLGDQTADMEKTATGITPIISINIHPSDMLNIALKYEHQTKLEFTNNTTEDFVTGIDPATGAPITMFPDGQKARYDIPSQIVAGATVKPIEKLMLTTGFHYYLDKNADWNGREEQLDGNSWEFALGAEYSLSDALQVSAGWLTTNNGVTEDYQTDLSFSLPSNSVGGGLGYQLNSMIQLNLAGSYTMYKTGEKNFSRVLGGNTIPITETYTKPIWIVAIGVNVNIGGK
ncbi:MAG: hypothetical protein JXA77_01140 [Bacteroidales bacterium]|nr:hypothetical protein [Bacteroidales bacterium]